ncbi:MAG: hypothetical protein AAGF74_11735 [Pseudomonadota bacterium]
MQGSVGAAPDGISFIDVAQNDQWPPTTPEGVRRYLTQMVEKTPVSLAENAAGVTARVLRVDETVLPVLVSDGRAGKASVLSPFAHHVLYPVHEISRRSKLLGPRALHVILSPLTGLLKVGAIDKAVFVNHWLLSGAPVPDLPPSSWTGVITMLQAEFPSHGLIVQDVKPELAPVYAGALAQAGGISVPTRVVYILDPAKPLTGRKLKKVRHSRGLARRLYAEYSGDLVSTGLGPAEVAQVRRLYRHSNIARHSDLNPKYTEAFFDLAQHCGEFRYHVWQAKERGKIMAFNLQRLDEAFMHWSSFGTDETARERSDRSRSLYELAVAADMVTCEEEGLLLDWGAGAEDFKRFRGAAPHAQVEVVFFNHLGPLRRFAWTVLAQLRRARSRQLERSRKRSKDRSASLG